MVQVINVNPHDPETKLIRIAADALCEGRLVAFPTETVYGLGANAMNTFAVTRIYEAKGRPNNDPLIVHMAEASWMARVSAEIPPLAWQLAEAFWPGPLTLILPKRSEIPNLVTAGLKTVAVRVPAHPVALALIRTADILVAAPSANRFGHTSPTRASHVLQDLGECIDILVNGGESLIGIESTVLDLTGSSPIILRPGGVTPENLFEIMGDVPIRKGEDDEGPQISPGLLLQHYSPKAELVYLKIPERQAALTLLRQIVDEEIGRGRRVGVLVLDEDMPIFSGLPIQVASLGSESDLWQAAHRLYTGMRSLDEQNVDIILVRELGKKGIGLALHDRLCRAASKVIT